MDRPRVYVETTIPSFYFEKRTSAVMVARRKWTRAWWEIALEKFDLATSYATYAELQQGPVERQALWLGLIRPMPVLETTDEVVRAAEVYIKNHVMPQTGEDAYHLAAAAVHRCDFLVTWDMQHLANGRKRDHIRKVTLMIGFPVPTIVTPLELLGRIV